MVLGRAALNHPPALASRAPGGYAVEQRHSSSPGWRRRRCRRPPGAEAMRDEWTGPPYAGASGWLRERLPIPGQVPARTGS